LKLTVAELIDYSSGISGFQKESVAGLCAKMQLEIAAHMKKRFYELSGGMKQKVLISIALARGCGKIIFDEPTANLDTAGRERFLDLVGEYGGGKSIIFICHRLEDVSDLVSRKIEMDMGSVINDEAV
jgi:ABC-2 type transport system ATP-binding protein